MVLMVLCRCGERCWWWCDGGGGWLMPSYSAPNTCGLLYSLPPPPAPSVQRRQPSRPDPRPVRELNQWADMTFISCDRTLTATHDAWQPLPPHPDPPHCRRRRQQELHIRTAGRFFTKFLSHYEKSQLSLFPMLALLGQGRRRNKLPISDAAVSSDQEAGKDKPKASGSSVRHKKRLNFRDS